MEITISNSETRIASNFKYLYNNHKDFLLLYIKLNFEAVHNIEFILIDTNSQKKIIKNGKFNLKYVD